MSIDDPRLLTALTEEQRRQALNQVRVAAEQLARDIEDLKKSMIESAKAAQAGEDRVS